MAETTTNSSLVVKQWEDQFFMEYVRENRFKRYMGADENSIIQLKEDLTKKKGDRITIPFVTRLAQAGTTGNAVLEGNEEALGNYGWPIDIDVNRHAVVVSEFEEQKSAIDLLNAARMTLKTWIMEKMRGGSVLGSKFGIIDNLGAVYDGTTYALYADASEAVKDGWLANNSDRVLFGDAVANNSSNDHSASLANLDLTSDRLKVTTATLAKRLAKTMLPALRPIKINDEEEWFVMFCNSRSFADLQADSTMTAANREGWVRYSGSSGKGENPLFRDGDMIYDGIIFREVPEIPIYDNVGSGGTVEVGPNYLCGAQAIGVAFAQRPTTRRNGPEGSDYGYRQGVGIQEMRGTSKLFFNNKQNGVFTLYNAVDPA